MTRDWLDTGNHGIRIGLEYGSIVDTATRGAITADTVSAEVSNLEVWIDTDDWPFTDVSNRLEVSGSAVVDDAWNNLSAGTSSSKKLKELNPQSNALTYGSTVTRACTVKLQNIEAAGETLSGTHNFTFPARPYHIPNTPSVAISASTITCSGNQTNAAADRFWKYTDWYLETNGVRAALWLNAPGHTTLVNIDTAADNVYRGFVYSENNAGVSAAGVTGYFFGPLSAPGTPVVSKALNSTTVNISWAAGAAPAYTRSYLLERSLNGGAWTQIHVTNGLAFADSVALGSVAYYRVRALSPAGANQQYSAFSAISAASPSGKHWTTPNPPGVSLALTGASTATIAITGNQTTPSLDKYWEGLEWQYSINGGSFGPTASLPGTTTSISMSGLVANNRYVVQARSKNTEGGVSAYVQSGPIYTKPSAPSGFTAQRASASSTVVNFAWTNNANWPGQYLIDRSLDGGTSWAQIIATAASSASTSQPISQAALYRIRVRTPSGLEVSAASAAAGVGVAFVSDRTKMKLGTDQIGFIYVGAQRVRRVYQGTSVVWEDGDA